MSNLHELKATVVVAVRTGTLDDAFFLQEDVMGTRVAVVTT